MKREITNADIAAFIADNTSRRPVERHRDWFDAAADGTLLDPAELPSQLRAQLIVGACVVLASAAWIFVIAFVVWAVTR
jgi:hypothetical protein